MQGGGLISRTTWPHASKARGHITPGGRRPDPTHSPHYRTLCTTHACPTHAAWRRGAAGDAHSLVAAARAHGEASALHPRRDHPLRASLRKLGGDACLAAPLVCGHAAARCGLHVRGGWCLQASLPARSAGRAKRDVTANTRSAQTGRCLRAGRRPPPSGVPPFEGGSMTSKGCHCEYAGCPYSIRLTPTGYTPLNTCPHTHPHTRPVRGPSPSSPSEGERAYGCAEIPILPTWHSTLSFAQRVLRRERSGSCHTVTIRWLSGGRGGRPGKEAASRTPSAPSVWGAKLEGDLCVARGAHRRKKRGAGSPRGLVAWPKSSAKSSRRMAAPGRARGFCDLPPLPGDRGQQDSGAKAALLSLLGGDNGAQVAEEILAEAKMQAVGARDETSMDETTIDVLLADDGAQGQGHAAPAARVEAAGRVRRVGRHAGPARRWLAGRRCVQEGHALGARLQAGPGRPGLDRPLENTICPSDSAVTTVTAEGYYAGSEVARLSGIALQYWAVRQQHSDTRDLSHGTSRSYNLAREPKPQTKQEKL